MKKCLRAAVLPLLFAGAAQGGSCIVSGSTDRGPVETVASAAVPDVTLGTTCPIDATLALLDARDVFTVFSPAGKLNCTSPSGFSIILR